MQIESDPARLGTAVPTTMVTSGSIEIELRRDVVSVKKVDAFGSDQCTYYVPIDLLEAAIAAHKETLVRGVVDE